MQERRILFDGEDMLGAASDFGGHFTAARANFNPGVVSGGVQGIEDAPTPGGVHQEVLSEALRHRRAV
jgi:hypothetical protein